VQHSKSSTATPTLYGTRLTSPRDHQVIELVAQGLKNCEVAEIIGTTEHVVKNYLRAIFDKLGVWNRLELALWYEARRYESIIYGQSTRRWSNAALLQGDSSQFTHPGKLPDVRSMSELEICQQSNQI
jgi:DNA-binding CsgD family transcriptional regulator